MVEVVEETVEDVVVEDFVDFFFVPGIVVDVVGGRPFSFAVVVLIAALSAAIVCFASARIDAWK